MSVMSAAEARQAASTSPEIPSHPLRIVRSVTGQDDPAADGYLPGPGDETPAEPDAAERDAGTLRVTQVRTVREVRVRMLRAKGARTGIVPPPRAAAPAGGSTPASATAPAGLSASARVSSQAAAAREVQAARHVQTTGRAQMSGQAQVTSQVRVARQARVTRQAYAASRTGVPGQNRALGQTRVAAQNRVAGQAQVAQRPGPVRLTRRGRRVVAGLVVGAVIVAVAVLWVSLAGSVQASSHGSLGSPYQGMTQVVVRPGQTLWSVASAAEPSGNAWAVVQQIINVNALSSASVQAGQLLWVPKN
jgi:hypothetical protein